MKRVFHRIWVVLLAVGALAGCRQDMNDQERLDALEASDFFPDGAASRPIPAGTVARGQLQEDTAFQTGHLTPTELANKLPMTLTAEVLRRGQERFNIYCSVCHGRTGEGTGMIVRRGFPQPPSFHTDRLREAPLGHFVQVITNGYGLMYSYASRVEPADRWAIAAYIRALQLSQHATLADAESAPRKQLEEVTR
jgi:mono/diheme cytochrome c family protein